MPLTASVPVAARILRVGVAHGRQPVQLCQVLPLLVVAVAVAPHKTRRRARNSLCNSVVRVVADRLHLTPQLHHIAKGRVLPQGVALENANILKMEHGLVALKGVVL